MDGEEDGVVGEAVVEESRVVRGVGRVGGGQCGIGETQQSRVDGVAHGIGNVGDSNLGAFDGDASNGDVFQSHRPGRNPGAVLDSKHLVGDFRVGVCRGVGGIAVEAVCLGQSGAVKLVKALEAGAHDIRVAASGVDQEWEGLIADGHVDVEIRAKHDRQQRWRRIARFESTAFVQSQMLRGARLQSHHKRQCRAQSQEKCHWERDCSRSCRAENDS